MSSSKKIENHYSPLGYILQNLYAKHSFCFIIVPQKLQLMSLSIPSVCAKSHKDCLHTSWRSAWIPLPVSDFSFNLCLPLLQISYSVSFYEDSRACCFFQLRRIYIKQIKLGLKNAILTSFHLPVFFLS